LDMLSNRGRLNRILSKFNKKRRLEAPGTETGLAFMDS
jgi:hypothetical protein